MRRGWAAFAVKGGLAGGGAWDAEVGGGGFVEDEASDAQGAIGHADGGDVSAPERPEGTFALEGAFQPGDDILGLFGQGADVGAAQQFVVAFLLAGHDLVDQHGALAGDGLLDGGTAGFADDDVMGADELGHAAGPADDFDAILMARGEPMRGFEHLGIAARGDGDVPLFEIEEAFDDLGRFLFSGVHQIENAGAPTCGDIGKFGLGLGEFQLNGEAHDADLVGRDGGLAQGVCRGVVGDEEEVALAAIPEGVNRDGIGDDGNAGEITVAPVLVNLVKNEVVDGVGADNGVGLVVGEEFLHGLAQAGQGDEVGFHHAGAIHQVVETLPQARGFIDGREVGLTHEFIETAVAAIKEIEHFDFGFVFSQVLNGVTNIACGRVMPLAKSCRENEYPLHKFFPAL